MTSLLADIRETLRSALPSLHRANVHCSRCDEEIAAVDALLARLDSLQADGDAQDELMIRWLRALSTTSQIADRLEALAAENAAKDARIAELEAALSIVKDVEKLRAADQAKGNTQEQTAAARKRVY